MLPLHGVGVLVTRPEHQATALCRLLEEQGARTFRFPALTIEPLAAAGEIAVAARATGFDVVIFTSANAVRHGVALLGRRDDASGNALAIAAIGPATTRALEQLGWRVDVRPAGGFDSESLLGDPRLAAVTDQRVLLIKGSGGRDLLAAELTRRGARVTVADVYTRMRPQPGGDELARLEARFAARSIQVITATSVEVSENIVALATPALRAAFAGAQWVVPGARVAEHVRGLIAADMGRGGGVLIADSAEDQDLTAAVVRWRSRESGA